MTSNRFHTLMGEPKEAVLDKVRAYMQPWLQDFIRLSPFAVLATANADGDCDCSPRGGLPGFVKILSDTRLAMPDYWGNRLFHSFGNIDENPKCALLFMIPGVNETVRVNGRCQRIDAEEAHSYGLGLEVHVADRKTAFVQGLLIDVDEAYSHCPRSFKFGDLWCTKRIEEHHAHSPILPRPNRT